MRWTKAGIEWQLAARQYADRVREDYGKLFVLSQPDPMPLEDIYTEGKKHYPTSSRDPDWFRAMVSPYYINADFHPSTKEQQDRLMKLTLDYLNVYYELWQKDEPRDDDYMRPLISRRQAMRTNMLEKDPGGIMVENAFGKEIAHLGLEALF